MTPLAIVAIVALVVVVLLFWWFLGRANRIDRLHQKVSQAGATLDSQLLRRAALALDLASSGHLAPRAAADVAAAARACLDEAREADLEAQSSGQYQQPGRATLTHEREAAESELTRALRRAVDVDSPDPLVQEVVTAWRRVTLARRFHNEAVAQVLFVRNKAAVRVLRLAGTAQLPRTFEMDDALE